MTIHPPIGHAFGSAGGNSWRCEAGIKLFSALAYNAKAGMCDLFLGLLGPRLL